MTKQATFLFQLATYFIATALGAGIFVLQIGWGREISIPMGGDTLAITTILFAFLVGLGLGGEYFGRLADKTKSPWKQCGTLALLGSVSIFVVSIFFLPGIFGAISYAEKSYIYTYLWRFGLSSILIFIPTFFLGGLLPTLLKFLTKFNGEVGVAAGKIYALFSLGGVLGALSSGFIFIPYFGTGGTITIAITIFAIIATIVWLLKLPVNQANWQEDRKITHEKNDTTSLTQNKNIIRYPKVERYLLMLSLALIGAIAISLEIIWTRALGLMIGSSLFGFSIMVTTCLVGISLGSFLSSRFINNIEHPFAWFSAFTVLAGVTAVGTSWFINELPWWFNNITNIVGPISSLDLILKFLVSTIVLLPPMAIIGGLFPLSVNVILKSPLHSGRTVGRLFSLYMIGSGVGGLFTSIIIIPSIGLKSTIALFTSALIILGALLLIEQKITQKKPIYITQGVLAIIFAIINLIAQPPWNPLSLSVSKKSLHEPLPSQPYNLSWVAYEDGLNASISVIDKENINTRSLFINGVETLSIPIENAPSEANLETQELMSILPVVLSSQEPRSTLVLGVGTGKTLSTILKDPRVNSVDVIEIEPAMYKMTTYFNHASPDILKSEKITKYVGDSRDFLISKYERYNIITSSYPLPSHNLGSNNISSQFYKAISDRLTGDGIFCQWIKIDEFDGYEYRAIVRTFRNYFPIMMIAEGGNQKDLILIGSRSPFHLNINSLQERLKSFSENGEGAFTYSTLLSHLLVGPNGSYKLGLGATILFDSNPPTRFSTSTTNNLNKDLEKTNLKLTREFIDGEIAKLIQTDFQSSEKKASILAQIAIDGIRNLPVKRATMPKSALIKSYITSSFEEESTPEALFAYALLTDTDQNEIFQNVMSYKSTSPISLMIKGELALNIGELKIAKNFFDQAISKEPYLARAYYLKGVTCQQLNQPDEAINSYKLAAGLGSSDASISLGNIYFNNNETAEAENWYEKATSLKPTSWIAWDNLGKVYYEQNRMEEAIKAFRYVIFLKQNYVEPHRYLGNIYKDLGKFDYAIEHYEIFLSQSHDSDRTTEVNRMITSIKDTKNKNQ